MTYCKCYKGDDFCPYCGKVYCRGFVEWCDYDWNWSLW